jgi:hypothetical protein
MIENLSVLNLKGHEIIPFIPDLASLRIEIFNEYPYLYEGNLEYEYNYLNIYVECPESIIILLLNDEDVVGASSAIPLEFETIEFQKPFLEHDIDVKKVFYFGESVLKPEFRGHKLYRHFFTQRELAAKAYGSQFAAFAAIERADTDLRKPEHYVPLDDAWKHFGYEKHPELQTYFEWKEHGEQKQTPKLMTFWLKKL